MPTKRPDINQEEIDGALNDIRIAVNRAINKHGSRTFSSVHEMYGILKEEFNELEQKIFNHRIAESQNDYHQSIKDEMMDVAAVLAFGIACIDQGTMDW